MFKTVIETKEDALCYLGGFGLDSDTSIALARRITGADAACIALEELKAKPRLSRTELNKAIDAALKTLR